MTTVHVDLRIPQPNTTDRAAVGGMLDVSLYHRAKEGEHFVLVTAFGQILVDGQTDLELTPTDGTNAWLINERVRDGSRRFVAVPDSPTSVQYVDLLDVDPATLEPSSDEALAAWIAAALTATTARDQAVAAAAGSAGSIAGKADKSANLSDLASASAARSNLGLGSAATQPVSAFATPANLAEQAAQNMATYVHFDGSQFTQAGAPVGSSATDNGLGGINFSSGVTDNGLGGIAA
jgi:hypothetical protein